MAGPGAIPAPGAPPAPPADGLPFLPLLAPLKQMPGQALMPYPKEAPAFPTHPFARSPRDFFMVEPPPPRPGY
jgi:hypothetical protein